MNPRSMKNGIIRRRWLFLFSPEICSHSISPSSPLLRCLSIASCHILTPATAPTSTTAPQPPFGTNYVRKSNRKSAALLLTRLMKMDGWLSANGTRHLTVDCLSPSALRSRAQSGAHPHPASTPLLMEMKTSRLMGSIMAVDRWKTSRFSPPVPLSETGRSGGAAAFGNQASANKQDGRTAAPEYWNMCGYK